MRAPSSPPARGKRRPRPTTSRRTASTSYAMDKVYHAVPALRRRGRLFPQRPEELAGEGLEILGFAAGDEGAVDHHLLVDRPGSGGDELLLHLGPRRHGPAADQAGPDADPLPVADGEDEERGGSGRSRRRDRAAAAAAALVVVADLDRRSGVPGPVHRGDGEDVPAGGGVPRVVVAVPLLEGEIARSHDAVVAFP